MDLVEFDDQLRRRVGSDETLRPFVCDGSPLDCSAFIVGANPATTLPFWPYWTVDHGFDRRSWAKDYERLRLAAGKRARSNTRERLERIVDHARPVRCLETNVYAAASGALAELTRSQRSESLLAFLVEAIQPRVILAHGNDAHRAIAEIIAPSDSRPVVLEVPHLRFASYREAEDLGVDLKRIAMNAH